MVCGPWMPPLPSSPLPPPKGAGPFPIFEIHASPLAVVVRLTQRYPKNPMAVDVRIVTRGPPKLPSSVEAWGATGRAQHRRADLLSTADTCGIVYSGAPRIELFPAVLWGSSLPA